LLGINLLIVGNVGLDTNVVKITDDRGNLRIDWLGRRKREKGLEGGPS